MRIAVITPRYAISGVPLAQWRLARALTRAGHRVDLIIGRCDPHLTVPPIDGVDLQVLDRRNVRAMLWPVMRYLRQIKPDVIFSAEDHLNAIVAVAALLTGSAVRISGSSRVTPYDTFGGERFSKRWWLKQLVPPISRRITAVTAVSQGIVDEYRAMFPGSRHQVAYNFYDEELVAASRDVVCDEPWLRDRVPVLVAAGNLAEWKGFDRLISAMARLRQSRTVRLLILGEGPLHDTLQKQIDALGLADAVKLVGHVPNPYPYYAQAAAFVHTARVESFGNVLVEAMACGASIVAVDCPVGPREVLGNGRYGHLVPAEDEEALVTGMHAALDAPVPRDRMAEGVRRFTVDTVIARHFALLGLAA